MREADRERDRDHHYVIYNSCDRSEHNIVILLKFLIIGNEKILNHEYFEPLETLESNS